MTTPSQIAAGKVLGMAHKFRLSAGIYNLGEWSKVAGLKVTWDVADHRIGNSDQYFKFAGIPKFDRIKLARAAEAAGTASVKSWLELYVAKTGGSADSGTLEMFTPAGVSVTTWTLKEMFPISWQISEFDASSSKVAIETLEIVHAGFLAHTWAATGAGGKPSTGTKPPTGGKPPGGKP